MHFRHDLGHNYYIFESTINHLTALHIRKTKNLCFWKMVSHLSYICRDQNNLVLRAGFDLNNYSDKVEDVLKLQVRFLLTGLV